MLHGIALFDMRRRYNRRTGTSSKSLGKDSRTVARIASLEDERFAEDSS